MAHSIMYFIRLAAACISAASLVASAANYDLSRTEEVDNLFDGVDRNGVLRVFSSQQSVLVNGISEQGISFGGSPRVADFNGDGADDLVVADSRSYLWTFPLGPKAPNRKVSSGTFQHTYVGDVPAVALLDWFGDKSLCPVIGTVFGDLIYCKNLGKGRITTEDSKPSYAATGGMAFPNVMAGTKPLNIGTFAVPCIADWDRDGRPDLIVGEGSYSANAVYLFRNTGTTVSPQFTPAERYWLVYGMGREHLAPAAGDLDGDGDLDLVVGEREGMISLFLNQPGPPTDDRTENFLLPSGTNISFGAKTVICPVPRPELTDWDGDGDLDMLIGAGDGTILLSLNSGTKQAPVFDEPKPLVATDTLTPYRKPIEWSVGQTFYAVKHHINNGARIRSMSEPGAEGQAINFGRYEFVDGFVGPSYFIFTSGFTFDISRSYSFKMLCRGKGVKNVKLHLVHHEKCVKQGADTTSEASDIQTIDIKPSAEWAMKNTVVKVVPHFKENEETFKTSGIGKQVCFLVEVTSSEATLDIQSIAFE